MDELGYDLVIGPPAILAMRLAAPRWEFGNRHDARDLVERNARVFGLHRQKYAGVGVRMDVMSCRAQENDGVLRLP